MSIHKFGYSTESLDSKNLSVWKNRDSYEKLALIEY